jgi:hypothetical protein
MQPIATLQRSNTDGLPLLLLPLLLLLLPLLISRTSPVGNTTLILNT